MTPYTAGFICVLALGAVGCSETAGTAGFDGGAAGAGGSDAIPDGWGSVDKEEAELHCLAWCDAGCDSNPGCIERCRYDLAQTCGELVLAEQSCVSSRDCDREHSDCDVSGYLLDDCRNAVLAACKACPEGTPCYDQGCGSGCFDMAGDCSASQLDGMCRVAVDSDLCAAPETCRVLLASEYFVQCGAAPMCRVWEQGDSVCTNGPVAPVEPCCVTPSPPEQPSACKGSESVSAPASCTGDGTIVTYLLTQFEILEDCHHGYDLDRCNGDSCIRGGLAAEEGIDGVDNGLAGAARLAAGLGADLADINQLFSDAICGKTERSHDDEGCETDVERLELRLLVNTDADEDCAHVTMYSGATELGSFAMNLSDEGCLSGTLPDIPVYLEGVPVEFSNIRLRVTVGEAGLSDGVMGATGDASFEALIVEAIGGGTLDAYRQLFDIRDDLSGGYENPCNAISGTYRIAGVALP